LHPGRMTVEESFRCTEPLEVPEHRLPSSRSWLGCRWGGLLALGFQQRAQQVSFLPFNTPTGTCEVRRGRSAATHCRLPPLTCPLLARLVCFWVHCLCL
jgi:hypothetical protein